jgi:predicted ATPase/transcriptional regulator with XRE-family HTH domain
MADTASLSFITFGDLLKHLRRRARLTQKELGIAVGYSEAHVARLESGQRIPDLATVQAVLVQALDLNNEPALAAELVRLAKLARADQSELEPATTPDSSNRCPNNLPVQLSSFIGREHELNEVQRLLHTTRLFTLMGAGGAGKTRLAIEIGMQLVKTGDYPEGVWLTRLEALADAHLVVGAVATAVGMPVTADVTLNGLIAYLHPRHLLLILNNCEHLITACAEFADALLRECPHLRILATSREALNIEGELIWRVPSMTISDAALLFATRARVAHADFALTDENNSVVEDICRRLDGIPLALELAAARLRVLSVQQIAARLDDRFALLTGGTRNALPRQQTLRATIDWSYDLLTDEEQVLLRKLSMFAGGWTLEAAEAVCGADTLDGLQQLVNKSLVVVDETAYGMRYRLLETIRQYGHEKLGESGELDEMRKAHAKHYTQWLESMFPHYAYHSNAEQKEWVERTDIEYDNLRAALDWALYYRKTYVVMRVAKAIEPFWHTRGYTHDGLVWVDAILQRTDLNPRERIHACVMAIRLSQYAGRLERCNDYSAQAHAVADVLGGEQLSLYIECYAASFANTIEQSIERVERAIQMVRRFDWIRELPWLTFECAVLMRSIGKHELADAAFDESIRSEQGYTPIHNTIFHTQQLGWLSHHQGDLVKARAYMEEAVSVAREQGSQIMLADCCVSLGVISFQLADYLIVMKNLQEAIRIYQWVGNQDQVAACLTLSSWLVEEVKGQHELAVRWLAAASQVRETIRSVEHHFALPRWYDHYLPILRSAVDPPLFERAWAEGRQMTLDQAVESVLAM